MKIIFKKQCPKCDKALKARYTRSFIERLFVNSKKYKCYNCNTFFLKI